MGLERSAIPNGRRKWIQRDKKLRVTDKEKRVIKKKNGNTESITSKTGVNLTPFDGTNWNYSAQFQRQALGICHSFL